MRFCHLSLLCHISQKLRKPALHWRPWNWFGKGEGDEYGGKTIGRETLLSICFNIVLKQASIGVWSPEIKYKQKTNELKLISNEQHKHTEE